MSYIVSMTTTNYPCPICKVNLTSQPGQVLDANDGVTVFCNNSDCKVEVFGHANNEANAFEIIKQKYTAHIQNKNV
jgi:hypothetical protein